MITRLFLIRHGATVLSAEDRFAGENDVSLSAIGIRQAELLRERLRDEAIVAAFASPLERAMHTARIVAEPHRCALVAVPELREIAHGRWEGMSRAEVEQAFPEEYRQWEEDPFTFAPEGAESGLQVMARALPALQRLVKEHEGAQIMAVAHKATIRLLLSTLLGFDPRLYRDRLDLSPASLNIVDFHDPASARLTLFNDVSHYGADPARIPEVPRRRLSKVWKE